ncbi:hypothetical protein OUZ56_010260 [Daphnia magna]|uniref:Uncharacterized protein n=1 Tax=Daphnia magna TaxID=35525 RepID=A0ABR0AI42_9CRUS|nr:hypothetical protein OUZ56_010260 [Daphnia magna]
MAPPLSVSSSDSAKRQRALESRDVNRAIANGSSKGDTLSVFRRVQTVKNMRTLSFLVVLTNVMVTPVVHVVGMPRQPYFEAWQEEITPKRLRDDNEDGSPANVCMLSRSHVLEIRRWMQYGIDSKSEGITLRSSYKPTFEGKYELMAPSLDPSMARKWLRNVGEYSDRAKLKDYWEKQLLSVQRKVKDVMEPLLFLLGSMPANCDAELPVGTATHLLGYVFSHISKLRRSNAMRHIAPKFSGRTQMQEWTKSDAPAVLNLAVEAAIEIARAITVMAGRPTSDQAGIGISASIDRRARTRRGSRDKVLSATQTST